jgi:phosphoglucosamine mutase
VERLFGTDGIRGVANVDLPPTLAYGLGRAVAHRLAPGGALVVGQDTRRSGDMLTAALVAGATSMGSDVHRLGVAPTPALADVVAAGPFHAGVMVSASHNPATDNGLKVLDERGLKLEDGLEDELERLILGAEALPTLGNTTHSNHTLRTYEHSAGLLEGYVERRRAVARDLGLGVHIVLDCANGSGSMTGPTILEASGAQVEVVFDSPDGTNINLACGASHPAALAGEVVARRADLGFALDGDGDRLIAVDRGGEVVDGDRILGILALDRLARGALPGGVVVVSVLSNGGLAAAVEAAGGRLVRTPVGDRRILEGMLAEGAALGGEKSGHVIVREHGLTGDGVLTALMVLDVMRRAGRPLEELAAAVPLLPQEQRDVPVRHKARWDHDAALQAAIGEAERRLDGRGRVLVRPSGTEPLLRVMVEGEDRALVAELAEELAAVAAERLERP